MPSWSARSWISSSGQSGRSVLFSIPPASHRGWRYPYRGKMTRRCEASSDCEETHPIPLISEQELDICSADVEGANACKVYSCLARFEYFPTCPPLFAIVRFPSGCSPSSLDHRVRIAMLLSCFNSTTCTALWGQLRADWACQYGKHRLGIWTQPPSGTRLVVAVHSLEAENCVPLSNEGCSTRGMRCEYRPAQPAQLVQPLQTLVTRITRWLGLP